MDKQKNIRVIIFDFDGTLIRLNLNGDRIREKLTSYFQKFGLDLYIRPIYPRIFEALKKLGKTRTDEEVKKIRQEAYALMEKEELKSLENAELVSGAKEVLDQIKKENIKIAIVSVNGRAVIKETFKKFGFTVPDQIVSRDDLSVVKPDLKVGEYVLKQLKALPHEAMLVGDSDYDMDLASKLGIKSVWLRSQGKLEYTNPDITIDELKEVLEII